MPFYMVTIYRAPHYAGALFLLLFKNYSWNQVHQKNY